MWLIVHLVCVKEGYVKGVGLFEKSGNEVQMVYVANRLLPTRAIVFMDFMTDVFSKIPALNGNTPLPTL